MARTSPGDYGFVTRRQSTRWQITIAEQQMEATGLPLPVFAPGASCAAPGGPKKIVVTLNLRLS